MAARCRQRPSPPSLRSDVDPPMSLARRTVTATGWNVLASVITVAVLFGRSIVLARLLPVEAFGVYSKAQAWLTITVTLSTFGMGAAFLNRDPETLDEDRAAAVFFTLKLAFTSRWLAGVIVLALALTKGPFRLALIWLGVTASVNHLSLVPRTILHRRVVHRRLALIQTLSALATTAVAVGLAWSGADLIALLATDAVTALLSFVLIYLWRPVWRPRLSFAWPTVRYYLRYGSRQLAASLLVDMLDRVDDLWTGSFLGDQPLGFYSRAFRFATYPRQILTGPVGTVAWGTYAELKGRRLELSQAFFRVNALLIRAGFLLAGLLILIAPEFIRLVLTPRWMPMLDAFRLMLLYVMLDPIKGTIGNLFFAVGEPQRVVQARFIQLIVLLASLFALGPLLGIAGVALAADVMMLVGVAILLVQARQHVDFNARRLFVVPTLALGLGLAAGLAAAGWLVPAQDLWTAGAKLAAFPLVYAVTLLLFERRQLTDQVRQLRQLMRPPPTAAAGGGFPVDSEAA